MHFRAFSTLKMQFSPDRVDLNWTVWPIPWSKTSRNHYWFTPSAWTARLKSLKNAELRLQLRWIRRCYESVRILIRDPANSPFEGISIPLHALVLLEDLRQIPSLCSVSANSQRSFRRSLLTKASEAAFWLRVAICRRFRRRSPVRGLH